MLVEITYACGHKEEIRLHGSGDRKEKEAEKLRKRLCRECYIIQKKEEENKSKIDKLRKIEQLERELELCELKGTPKQVQWAREIRYDFIMYICKNEVCKGRSVKECVENGFSSLHLINYALSSTFWIDHRDYLYIHFERYIRQEYNSYKINNSESAREAIIEMTMKPKSVVYEGVVKVNVSTDEVTAIFEKNEDFRMIIKSCGFKWDTNSRLWKKKCNEYTGTAQDRAAELINKLLNKGFSVMCADEKARERALSAKFKLENHRWIKYNNCIESFIVCWDRYKQDFYNEARKLPGAKWRSVEGGMVVPARNFLEVLDFAEINYFSISAEAKIVIESYQSSEIIVKAEKPVEIKEVDKLNEILLSDCDIIESLKDND